MPVATCSKGADLGVPRGSTSLRDGRTVQVRVRALAVSDGTRELEAVVLAGVAECDIPDVILTPRRRDREAGERRRVVANDVGRDAVAVTAGSDSQLDVAPVTQTVLTSLVVAQHLKPDGERAHVECHPVGGNERARTVNKDRGVVRSLRLETDADLAEADRSSRTSTTARPGRRSVVPTSGRVRAVRPG